MNQVSELGLKIDFADADNAAAALDRLADAAERAEAAIRSLQGAAHDGITIQIVGDIVSCEIRPPVNSFRSPVNS